MGEIYNWLDIFLSINMLIHLATFIISDKGSKYSKQLTLQVEYLYLKDLYYIKNP